MLSMVVPVLAVAMAPQPTGATLRGSGRNASEAAVGGAGSESAVAAFSAGPGAWDLNGGKGPWCDPGTASGREAASCSGQGDRGWDPCCAWEDCNIFDAVWDSTGPTGEGTWCWRSDFDKNQGTCWNGKTWDFWTGGTIYDWCPCSAGDVNCNSKGQKQMCISTSDNGVWWDWRQCYDWTGDADCWKNLLAEKCYTDHSMDVCYNGFIQDPDCGGSCPAAFMREEQDSTGLDMCIPEWS